MDAPLKTFRNTTVLLSIALLVLAAPLCAQQFSVNLTSVTLSGTQAQQVNVSSTTATQITFTTSVDYTSGDPAWLTVTSGGTTPTTLDIQIGGSAGLLSSGSHTAQVKLHATSPATGVSDQVITVNYSTGSGGGGGGGGGTGAVTASSTSVVLSATPGGISASQQITLSTTNSTPITFTLSNPTQTWLSVHTNTNQVSSGSNATLTLQGNAFGLTTNTYFASFSINPSTGGSITVNVQFCVGTCSGGSGTYQVSTSLLTFAYPNPSTGTVTVTSNNAAVTTFNIQASSTNNWLLVNGATQIFNQPAGTSLTVGVNTSAAALLATGTYSGQILVTNPANSADSTAVNVTLNVNGGSSGSGVLNPSSLSFSANLNGAQQTQQVVVNGTGAISANVGTCNGSVVGIQPVSSTTFNVVVFPYALSVAQTYTCSLSFTVGGTVYSLPVTLFLGSGGGGGGGGGTGGTLAPTSLTFAYQAGQSSVPPAQYISVNGTVSSVSVFTSGSTNFISASAGNNLVFVSVIGGLSAGTYSGTVTVNFQNGTSQSVGVTLNVTSGAVLLPNPGTLNFTFAAGNSNPTASVQVTASDGSALTLSNVTSSQSWVTVGTPTSTTTPATYPISINASGLPNGLNTANVTFSASGAANSPVTLPVVVLVSGSTGGTGPLTLGASSLTFSAAVNGQQPASQTLGVSAATTTAFNASVTGSNCGWLSISPSGSLSTNQNLTVTVNQAGLAVNTYSCNIALTANNQTQNVPVSLVVSTTGGGGGGSGNITVSPTSLNFTFTEGGVTPGVQGLSINSASGSSAVGITISATTTSGGNWLSAGVANGTQTQTPIVLNVGVNVTGLAAGTYNGNIVISPTGGTQVSVPVTLTVQSLTVSASPTSLTFTYRAGDPAPASQTVNVTGGSGLTFSAAASSTNNWLSVSPTSGSTPATLAVSINPANLSTGTYNGTITVTGTGTATGTSTVNVTVTVTAPLPTISRVTNGASFATANTVSAGEVITIFGTGIGPAQAAVLSALDSSGKVGTSLGGVQVLVGGYPAPMIYASSTQVSAVVPYEIASPIFLVSPSVQVRYLGQTSNGIAVTQASSAPGLFTANSSGSGPGAILNSNGTLNSGGNPANKGDVVVLYMTGEGVTNPASVSGGVTRVTTLPNGNPFTPQPLLPVAVRIDGNPALVTFWGEAPGLVSGVLQVNVQVPANARSGDLPIAVSVGGESTQNGVTVSVR